MKKSLLVGSSLAALLTGSAAAADLPVRAVQPYVAAPIFSWTGCYLGGQVGGGAIHDSRTNQHGNGAIAGGQIGCNYQTGMLVFGVEGDGFWSGIKNAISDTEGSSSSTNSTKNKYDFSIAGRFGVAIDRTFIYGKAGWVWGKFDFENTFTSATFNSITTGSATLDGLLIGTGLEYAMTPNWTVKAEYNYLNFGTKNVNFTTINNNGTFLGTDHVSADKHVIKVGFNYKFW